MAHFAKLDNNNTVEEVIVVHNNELLDENGNESEQKGVDFCTNLFGGRWIQTSYNHSFRGKFAGPGYAYDEANDRFVPPKPYTSWTLDETVLRWVPPKTQPGLLWTWDETSQEWIEPENWIDSTKI